MAADKNQGTPVAKKTSAIAPVPQESSGTKTRAQILAAAAELAKEKGAAHISIEAIAQRAGLSKGGLLYHFPKKDALIQALVEQHLAEVEAELAGAEATNGHHRSNAVARAFVGVSQNALCQHKEKLNGLLLAFAENPHLLDPLRAHQRRVVERIRATAADRDLSLIAMLVIAGIRNLDLFEAGDVLSDDERRAVIDRLLALLANEPTAEGSPGA
jgi:AcrR family transcriptional regulator